MIIITVLFINNNEITTTPNNNNDKLLIINYSYGTFKNKSTNCRTDPPKKETVMIIHDYHDNKPVTNNSNNKCEDKETDDVRKTRPEFCSESLVPEIVAVPLPVLRLPGVRAGVRRLSHPTFIYCTETDRWRAEGRRVRAGPTLRSCCREPIHPEEQRLVKRFAFRLTFDFHFTADLIRRSLSTCIRIKTSPGKFAPFTVLESGRAAERRRETGGTGKRGEGRV